MCITALLVLVWIALAAAPAHAEQSMGTGLAEVDPTGFARLSVASSTGGAFAFGIKSDGTVWAWGHNDQGQLGTGDTTDRTNPVQITALTGAREIATGSDFAMAILADGTVSAWGNNMKGQLAMGNTSTYLVPTTSAMMPTGPRQIALGRDHGLTITANGAVQAWGGNGNGQLGDGTADALAHSTPTAIGSEAGARAIYAGDDTSFAIRKDGTVFAWGSNAGYRLGDGTTTTRSSPTAIPTLDGARTLSISGDHGAAIGKDGTFYVWGANGNGELGIGDNASRTIPTANAALAGARAVSVSASGGGAITANGAVYTWGRNAYGQVGDGTATDRTAATNVASLDGARQLAMGAEFAMAILANGNVRSWGRNDHGALAIGTTTDRATPGAANFTLGCRFIQVVTSTFAASSDERYLSSYALQADGTVWAWGENGSGQLGIGSTADQTSPVQVAALSGVRQIAAGSANAVALRGDGTVYTWGGNADGQIGDGTTTTRTAPVQITALTGARQVGMGEKTGHAVMANGNVVAWGGNPQGQFGDGTTTSSSTPKVVSNLQDARELAPGPMSSHAIMADGAVRGWGYNGYRSIGDGSTTNRTTPVTVLSSAQGVRQLTSGVLGGHAILANGTVFGWGNGSTYYVGDGTNTNRPSPVAVTGFDNARWVRSGRYVTYAQMHNGPTKVVGSNIDYGFADNGAAAFASTPTAIAALAQARVIASGGEHAIAIFDSGTKGWGLNASGQVGDTSTTTRRVPVVVSVGACPDTTPPTPNPMTATGIAVSTSQIDWIATTSTDDVALHATTPYSLDTGTPSWQASTSFTRSSLAANTQYTYTARARDAAGNVSTGSVSRYTLSNAPTSANASAPDWNAVDAFAVQVQWTAAAGGATSYSVRSSANSYGTVVGNTTSTSHLVTGLAANTSYTFKVCGVNGDGVEETICSFTSSVVTPPVAPGSPTTTNITHDGVRIGWNAAPGADSYRVALHATSNCAGGSTTYDTSSSPLDVTSLAADRTYSFTITAQSTTNALGPPTSCSPLSTPNARTQLTVSVDSGSVHLGTGPPGTPLIGSSTLTVDTYGSTGYGVTAHLDQQPTDGMNSVPAYASPVSAPTTWTGSGFGITVSSATNLEAAWASGTKYAGLTTSAQTIHDTGTAFAPDTSHSTTTTIGYRLVAPGTQQSGSYACAVTYTVVGAL